MLELLKLLDTWRKVVSMLSRLLGVDAAQVMVR